MDISPQTDNAHDTTLRPQKEQRPGGGYITSAFSQEQDVNDRGKWREGELGGRDEGHEMGEGSIGYWKGQERNVERQEICRIYSREA